MKDRIFDMANDLCEAQETLESVAALMDEAIKEHYQGANDMSRFRIISYKATTDMAINQIKDIVEKLDDIWREMDKK